MGDVEETGLLAAAVAQRRDLHRELGRVSIARTAERSFAPFAFRAALPDEGGLLDEQLAGQSGQVQRGELLAGGIALGAVPQLRGGVVPQHHAAVRGRRDHRQVDRLQHVALELIDASDLFAGPVDLAGHALLLEQSHQAVLRVRRVEPAVLAVDAQG